jgi:hypothetical protein
MLIRRILCVGLVYVSALGVRGCAAYHEIKITG